MHMAQNVLLVDPKLQLRKSMVPQNAFKNFERKSKNLKLPTKVPATASYPRLLKIFTS